MKIDDLSAYRVLEEYKIPVADYFIFKENDNGHLKKMNKIEFPVVIKIDSPDIIHKSDEGFVQVVKKREDFEEKAKAMIKKAKKKTKNVNGVIVQEMVSGPEVILGANIDPQFGPVIMFGAGGILTEAIKDVSFRLIPIKKEDASEMVRATKIWEGLEKRKKAKIKDISQILMKLSKLMEDNKEIKEIDMNPIMITEKGPKAIDVRIITKSKYPALVKLLKKIS